MRFCGLPSMLIHRAAPAMLSLMCVSYSAGCAECPEFRRDWTVSDMQEFLRVAHVDEICVSFLAESLDPGSSYPIALRSNVLSARLEGERDKSFVAQEILAAIKSGSEPRYTARYTTATPGGAFSAGAVKLLTKSVTLDIRMGSRGFWIGNGEFACAVFVNDRLRDLVLGLARSNPPPVGYHYPFLTPSPPYMTKTYWEEAEPRE